MRMLAVGLVFFGGSVFGQEADKQPAQVTTTERVSFAPGGVLRLTTASSNLMVEAWDRPEVEVTTIKTGRRACLDSVRIVTERPSGNELAISAAPQPGKKCGVKLELQVSTPRDTRLVIHHGAGYVYVSRVTGEIEAISRSGDIFLMLPDEPDRYSIDAKSKWGNIISDFAGTVHNMKLLGEEFTRANPPPSRRIYLRIGFGGITIKQVPSTPEAPVAAGGQ
jgi:hypothetical protein